MGFRGIAQASTERIAVIDQDHHAALASVGDAAWSPHIAPLPFAQELFQHRRACASPEEFVATMPSP